ncbi:M23 family metallopeptidase [Pseudonocardiaceae bacterium YIM PH 21723]|nr:M23 family metallopeptidase [Pseudonocardiaceae bacterium YIM PH 21723]
MTGYSSPAAGNRLFRRLFSLVLAIGLAVTGLPQATAAPAPPPSMEFPFARGQWAYSGGIHTDTGENGGVQNAIDLLPTDRRVRAAAAGTARRIDCPGKQGVPWLKIDHGNGWATGYYQTKDISVYDGQWINAGQEVGWVGTALDACGGANVGEHLHLTLWKDGRPNSWHDMWLSGYKITTEPRQWSGRFDTPDGRIIWLPADFRYS